ncbi:invasion associated locus B family protein [Methylocella tundrae]|uniref:Invasion-associated locus B family protein n=1 Tax=Methylocella tundrae TaxID=227605 RepID=A0A4U8YZI7_METTU|nr:invasion associated locus B family protein [Methylocella tundrae]WPP04974.1 invasion associated locus B family protein [Methylocella tundrae]VFU07265.1 Invasion-associated locus B family protein [Methylocella tundrae]
MSFSLKRFGAAGLAGLFLLAGAEAFAQAKKTAPAKPAPAAAPAAPAEAPPQAVPGSPAPQPAPQQGPFKVELYPTQNDWTKVCGKDQAANKEICYTTRDFSAQKDQAPVLALAVYDIKGEDTRIVRLLLPVGLMLRPGFRFAIDKGATQEGAFEICFPNGCFAEARVKGTTIAEMKKGTTMSIDVKNQANNLVTFSVPMANFEKAFEGPPVDPKVLEEQQKKLQEELQKRAEEERKKLEAAKPDATGGAAPPTAAPAAPAKP